MRTLDASAAWRTLWRLAAALFAIGATPGPAQAVPSFEQVRAAHARSDVTLLDRHGEPIQTLRVDFSVRRLPWVALARISPALRDAVVQGEDRRFWEHGGVDWAAVARSAAANARSDGSVQGASTLTMQLAALLDDDLARPAGGRSLAQKLRQVTLARQIESMWSKPQILEAYLNRVPFRGENVGVGAAALTLFGKQAAGLDAQESALLAALVRSPNAHSDAVVRRACALLAEWRLRCAGLQAMAERAFGRPGAVAGAERPGEQIAPHFARWLLARAAMRERRQWPGTLDAQGLRSALDANGLRSALDANGLRSALDANGLRSALDARVQRLAIAALRTQLAELAHRSVEDGAVLVLDNASGDVLAWVGSSGPGLSGASEVDAVLARRQPGSTLKPFVYALAFERGLITPASLILDAPTDLDGGAGAFVPRNYDKQHHGWVSARTALASSLNLPAVRVGAWLGADALFEQLNAFGLDLAESGGYHGHALALGSADVTLLGLTNAYRALANGGRVSEVRALADSVRVGAVRGSLVMPGRIPAPAQVADPRAVFQVTDILADTAARAMTFGLDSALVTRGFAAVKTGTSKDMRDNWCIGFTDRYTVGVWVGNASGAPMHNVSGTHGAAPVWRALVHALHGGRPSRPPAAPAGLRRQVVAFDGGVEPGRREWLVAAADAATAPHRVQRSLQAAGQRALGIEVPRDGSVFALDPDMPAPVQRIAFRGEAGQWWLDGRRLGEGPRVDWAPRVGRHRLELRAADGRVLGRAGFEVRGAALRRSAMAKPPSG